MANRKKSIPPAMCSICHLVAYDSQRVGSQCTSISRNYRCTGIFFDTTQPSDWLECAKCGGTGLMEGAPCRHCRSVGWLFVRPGGFDRRQPEGMPIIGHVS